MGYLLLQLSEHEAKKQGRKIERTILEGEATAEPESEEETWL